jgi:GNAT superfamily N-acetyltransferase
MEVLIRPLAAGDKPAVTLLLDDAVGAGFWEFDGPGEALALVATLAEDVTGVILCRLEPAGGPDARVAFAAGDSLSPAPDGRMLHVRAVAVAPAARRAGIARRLIAHADAEAAALGVGASYLFAWLPAGRPEPAAVPLYTAAGYVPGRDIGDFYAAGSIAAGANCPYCGPPPCRCAARPFAKRLGAT